MKRNNHASVVRLTSLAILAALVVVLQTVASGIRIGPVPISLTLVPIVVGPARARDWASCSALCA